jgi:hypothetical protein
MENILVSAIKPIKDSGLGAKERVRAELSHSSFYPPNWFLRVNESEDRYKKHNQSLWKRGGE